MNASEHLKPWTHPRDYGGFSPDGDYCVLSRHRDSDSVERSNWECACAQLGAEAYDGGTEYAHARPAVYHWRAGHWAVGWVEYLMVRADAPQETLDAAGEIVCSLADYPLLDESHHSELEWNEASEYWARMSVRERAQIIRDRSDTVSIFAARRESLPEHDDNGAIFDYLRS